MFHVKHIKICTKYTIYGVYREQMFKRLVIFNLATCPWVNRKLRNTYIAPLTLISAFVSRETFSKFEFCVLKSSKHAFANKNSSKIRTNCFFEPEKQNCTYKIQKIQRKNLSFLLIIAGNCGII